MADFRESMANMLHDSYIHKQHDDLYCAVCGKKGGKLALHVIEYSQDQYKPLPQYFVPMSASRGIIRGSFAVCDECAPPCKRCKLPIYTDKITNFFNEKSKELQGNGSLRCGNGICQHIQWGSLFKSLIKKIFHIK